EGGLGLQAGAVGHLRVRPTAQLYVSRIRHAAGRVQSRIEAGDLVAAATIAGVSVRRRDGAPFIVVEHAVRPGVDDLVSQDRHARGDPRVGAFEIGYDSIDEELRIGRDVQSPRVDLVATRLLQAEDVTAT